MKLIRKIIFEVYETEPGKEEYKITYEVDPSLQGTEGITLDSNGIIFLAQHGKHFKKVISGDSLVIAKLLVGCYENAVKMGQKGYVEETQLASMMAAAGEDIANNWKQVKGEEKASQEKLKKYLDIIGSNDDVH